mmetsp:Transcript_11100/g.32122  ORF Transcript_11100/g.32122 Transcript_11100/m.32122 type:complete len:105 (-) Transcript_11100:287-601(-)
MTLSTEDMTERLQWATIRTDNHIPTGIHHKIITNKTIHRVLTHQLSTLRIQVMPWGIPRLTTIMIQTGPRRTGKIIHNHDRQIDKTFGNNEGLGKVVKALRVLH